MRVASLAVSLYLGFFSQLLWAQSAQDLKSEIYSKLDCCPCEVPFEKCGCKEAIEMKAYISALLGAGTAKDEIFYKVAKKFSLKVIIDDKLRQDMEKRLAREIGDNRPQIVLEPQDYFDFGTVSKELGEARKTFKLYNKGNAGLIIKNIAVSCPCVSVSLIKGSEKSPYFGVKGALSGWRQELKPNESAELEVVLDLNHKSVGIGELLREIMIVSNDPLYPNISITVRADVAGGKISA